MHQFKPQDWRILLKGAFAGQTAPFAGHPCDEIRARKMFHAAMNAGVNLPQILLEAESYLKSRGCAKELIQEQLSRIEQYPHNPAKKLKSKRAWLITWEGTNTNGQVVAILNYRKSGRTVRDFIEELYITSEYALSEKLTYARSPKNNPYPAEFDRIGGVPWEGRITCGHNPFLYGRLVVNLAVCNISEVTEYLVWEELEKPTIEN